MKKAVCILLVVILVLGLAVAGMGFYLTRTPEYALLKIYEDVRESGMEGLMPHLTGDAKQTVDTLTNVAENSLVQSLVGLLAGEDRVQTLKSELQNVTWELKDVLKSNQRAAVILAFNYKDELSGTIEFTMIREEDWMIDSLKMPEFDDR